MNDHTIRPFQDDDEGDVIDVWYRSGRAAYSFLPTWQALTVAQAGDAFRRSIRSRCDIWVITIRDKIAGFLAMKGSYIGWLYIDPNHWREGLGSRLLDFAKSLSPHGLELHTHQENHTGRGFYEKHEFQAVRFGVSPPPECAPDVEYHWRPKK
ncbi:MAG TPA: GNAT family N-acetyltransferase [Terriglobia bacterium]|nr:GNAT family N-acetyltransferase [Terriglobia bacterium]